MVDREKVIKGLMVCFTRISCKGKGCPYESEYERSGLCQAHLRDDALALLKAQEAVEPIRMNHNMDSWLDHYKCPVCDGLLTYDDNYCSTCGRKVKWE